MHLTSNSHFGLATDDPAVWTIPTFGEQYLIVVPAHTSRKTAFWQKLEPFPPSRFASRRGLAASGGRGKRSFDFPILFPASIRASAIPAAFVPHHSSSALEARSMRGLLREADGSPVAEMVSEAHDLPRGFRMVRSEKRIHALSCFHIGGGAAFVWALAP